GSTPSMAPTTRPATTATTARTTSSLPASTAPTTPPATTATTDTTADHSTRRPRSAAPGVAHHSLRTTPGPDPGAGRRRTCSPRNAVTDSLCPVTARALS